jgi:hypothetical protein
VVLIREVSGCLSVYRTADCWKEKDSISDNRSPNNPGDIKNTCLESVRIRGENEWKMKNKTNISGER